MSSHPHFDDRDTLQWHTRWADALAQARAEDKLVFIEMGRQACSQCRSLVEAVVPQPDIAERLQRKFVALASDCDAPEPAVLDLAMQNMADAMMLPFVLFTDAEGTFLSGSHGSVDPSAFRKTLEDLAP